MPYRELYHSVEEPTLEKPNDLMNKIFLYLPLRSALLHQGGDLGLLRTHLLPALPLPKLLAILGWLVCRGLHLLMVGVGFVGRI